MAVDKLGHTSTLSHSWEVKEIIICNPFNTDLSDDCSTDIGLTGQLYYLTDPGVGSGDLLLDDYLEDGRQVPYTVHMSQISFSVRDFDGFMTSIGLLSIRNKQDNKSLSRWFSLKLNSFLVPNIGHTDESYEFAILADGGVRVVLDGETILENEREEAPRGPIWTCSQSSYDFSPSMKKSIEISYFHAYEALHCDATCISYCRQRKWMSGC